MALIRVRFFLNSLSCVHDILFIQEHWLAPFDLDKLNTVACDMICFASSAMCDVINRDCLFGRPFGGVAIYVKQSFASIAELISTSKRYVILQIGQLLLINVYLPCVSSVDRVDEFIEFLASIMNDISDLQYEDVIFGGDLNIELDNNDILCRHLDSFVRDLQLTFVDEKISSNDKFTYRVESTGSCSTIDHFAVSRKLYQHIHDVKIVDGAENFSDHCPLILETDVYLCCRKSVESSLFSKFKVDCFRWDIADCTQYYLLTYNRFN